MDKGNGDKSKKVIIGYDLTNDYAQISYYFLNQDKPDTLKASQDGAYNIPVCLCKKHGVNQWYFGEQALQYAEEGKGTAVKNLFDVFLKKEKIEIDKNEVSTEELLLLYIKKCLGKLNILLSGYETEALMITVDRISDKLVRLVERLKRDIGSVGEKVYLQTHEESLFYYIMNQDKELWKHEVCVFDFSAPDLMSHHLTINKKTEPNVCLVQKAKYESFLRIGKEIPEEEKSGFYRRLDERLCHLFQEFMQGKLVSSVYLIGEGFEGDWYKESLAYLCRTRRVFGGSNLYSIGACYALKERLAPTELSNEYIFLGMDKLKFNIGVSVLSEGKEERYPLLDAGVNWYEALSETDFILDEGNGIDFIITSLYGNEEKLYEFVLEGLEVRPPKMTRVGIKLSMETENRLVIRVTDKGFGNFYIATNKEWQKVIEV